MIRAKINGIEREFDERVSILEAAKTLGIEVPTLCHDERLKDVGACRMCLVKVNGMTREITSCTAAITDGIEVETDTPEIRKARKINLQMLARDYPFEAFLKHPEKAFHKLCREYNLTEADFAPEKDYGNNKNDHSNENGTIRNNSTNGNAANGHGVLNGFHPTADFSFVNTHPQAKTESRNFYETDAYARVSDAEKERDFLIDDSHTYIHVDMRQCIDCYRCVRICDEVQGQFVWQILGRGEHSQIVPDSLTTFAESSCVACGACVDTCPTGALEDKSILKNGLPEVWTKTTCPYCGTGCEMMVGVKNDKVVQVKPAMDAPVNAGHLCVKGRYAFDFVDAEDRVTEPMIRAENGEWQIVSWDEAINFTAEKLKNILAENGKDAIAVLGSARATNEENYLAQKFARVVIETNNVDCCARVCHTPTAAAMKMMLGTGAATNSFDDIEMSQTILICGANPTENHPIPGARMKQAVRNGANLIVIDPRRTELTQYADVHLALRPGTNIPMFNALAHTIIEEGLADEEFIKERVTEFEAFREFVKNYSPEEVAEICGVEAEDIRQAARIYATAKPAMCFHGLGMTEHLQGTEGVMTIVNLALLTGNIGKRGTGVNPLRGQNNVQGSAQMGCDPGILTGSIALDDGRAHFESVWKAPVPTEKGLNQLQMIDAAKAGKLKALWTIGYDVFLSNANSHETAKGFENLELCIIQDFFMNETARHFGHVFFPVATSFEKDGTFMNAERRVQRIRKSVSPRGNSRTDWEVICDLAKAMDKGEFFDFHSAEEIWNEIRLVWRNSYGITYERLEKEGGLQWNCPDLNHPGTEVLHAESFSLGKTASLRQIKYRPTKEVVTEDFPLLLTTGRSLYQFNAGTMTMRTPNAEIRPTDLIIVSPLDADKLAIANGETVRLMSKYGEAILPVQISGQMKQGELFATFHDARIFLNYATSAVRDRFTQAPEYKVTAVRIEKLNGENL
jgi:formate dehydrogenase major subunit